MGEGETDSWEARAGEWLRSLGFWVEKIPEDPVEKKPDFRITPSAGASFYVEVKGLEGPGDDQSLESASLFNKISKKIRDAQKQFSCIDPNHDSPRVLLFVADDFRIHRQKLLDFIEGQVEVDGQLMANLARYRFGKVRAEIGDIDAYAILETNGDVFFFYNAGHAAACGALKAHFGHTE